MLKFASKPQSAALAFLVAGSAWFLIGTLYGLVAALHLMAPELYNNISWLNFGRMRPIHVNTVLFGFVATTLVGCAIYYVPALLRTRLWSERLGWFSWLCWNAAVLSGPTVFPFGLQQNREYTEYLYPFKVLIMLAILTLIVNLTLTIAGRKEKTLYVSVWYAVGALIWTAGVYPIGNVMWRPQTQALPGLVDSILLWFYGHNMVGLLLTPLAIGIAYFVLPRVTRAPLYSHRLSLVGFWALVATYTQIGGHHILQAPIPNWLRTVTVVGSIMMILPVFVVLANLWLTTRGRGMKLWGDPAGRFVLAGTMWYLLVCLQGPLQSLPSVQAVTHFTNWVIGHSHIAVLGFAGFIALGGMWHMLPLVCGRKLYSARLVNLQFGLLLFGLVGFFAVLTTAGLIQGHAWATGETVYVVLPSLNVYMALRAMLGLFIIAGAAVGLYNVVMTLRHGEPLEPAALEAEPLDAARAGEVSP